MRVRVILAQRWRTQTWLAKRLHTSSSYLSRVLTGERLVGVRIGNRLLQVLGEKDWDKVFEFVE